MSDRLAVLLAAEEREHLRLANRWLSDADEATASEYRQANALNAIAHLLAVIVKRGGQSHE